MNLLGLSGALIPWQTVQMMAGGEQLTDDSLNTYYSKSETFKVRGRIIPLTNKMYSDKGLDFKKRYVNFLIPSTTDHLTRSNIASSIFNFKGVTYQVQTPTDNYDVLGWDRFLCVAIPFVDMTPSTNPIITAAPLNAVGEPNDFGFIYPPAVGIAEGSITDRLMFSTGIEMTYFWPAVDKTIIACLNASGDETITPDLGDLRLTVGLKSIVLPYNSLAKIYQNADAAEALVFHDHMATLNGIPSEWILELAP